MGKIYARLIYQGLREYSKVPKKYKAAAREAYLELYGINLDA